MTKLGHQSLMLGMLMAAIIVTPSPSNAQSIGADTAWCQIDDPASWAAARQDMIDAGKRDLADIPCPEKSTGSNIPKVLHLPMPCARSMVFQRVDVPVSHPLQQVVGYFGRSVDLESETPQTVLSNGAWTSPVAGSFTVTKDSNNGVSDGLEQIAARSYYIARYELTTVQWAIHELGLLSRPASETELAAGETCTALDAHIEKMNLRLIPAQGGLSWFDAIEFSRDYSNWLVSRDEARIASGALPDLPWEQGSTGYVRLPTEAEWEYAARGGASQVTEQARTRQLPVVRSEDDEGFRSPELDEICAEKPQSQGVLLGAVGRKTPNALGLYDVVCNAEEIVLDLFRPTRPDGLSGQVGGVTTKGGTSVLFRERNTIGRRTEAAALFGLKGEGATATMGVRLAIAAPVFSGRRDSAKGDANLSSYTEGRLNEPYEKALMIGRAELRDRGVGPENDKDAENLAKEVNKLRLSLSEGKLTQKQLLEQAERLQIELERLDVQLNAEARSATLLTIRTGVVTSNLIDRMGRNLFNAMVQIETLRAQNNLSTAERKRIELYRGVIQTNENRIQASFDLYLQVHAELGARTPEFIRQQLAVSRQGVGGFNVDVFGSYLDRFERHSDQVRAARGTLTEALRNTWLAELDTTRERRKREFPRLQP